MSTGLAALTSCWEAGAAPHASSFPTVQRQGGGLRTRGSLCRFPHGVRRLRPQGFAGDLAVWTPWGAGHREQSQGSPGWMFTPGRWGPLTLTPTLPNHSWSLRCSWACGEGPGPAGPPWGGHRCCRHQRGLLRSLHPVPSLPAPESQAPTGASVGVGLCLGVLLPLSGPPVPQQPALDALDDSICSS